jgi:hypothetical protein
MEGGDVTKKKIFWEYRGKRRGECADEYTRLAMEANARRMDEERDQRVAEYNRTHIDIVASPGSSPGSIVFTELPPV